jgi:arylamine N-acetyltransferase
MTKRSAWVDAYLARIGVGDPGEPSVQSLFALHRGHVERIAYETIDIHLGRPPGIDPQQSIRRIVCGRGGYCYNLNGAFSALLAALGYRVTRHRGEVHGSQAPPQQFSNHMAVTVELDGEPWMVDVGLANAHHEPLRLRPGMHPQGPFTFGLQRVSPPSAREGEVWRFAHDPLLAQESFPVMDFSLAPAHWTDFLPRHAELSTSPDSAFVRTLQIYRRYRQGTEFMLGCVLYRVEGRAPKSARELTSPTEWFEAATEVFGLDLSGLSAEDRERLWRRIHETHAARL